jgi:hypothetical protein
MTLIILLLSFLYFHAVEEIAGFMQSHPCKALYGGSRSEDPLSCIANFGDDSTSEIALSPLVNEISTSQTIEIHSRTIQMEKDGQKVYSLCVGEPDYQPPEEVISAIVSAKPFHDWLILFDNKSADQSLTFYLSLFTTLFLNE